MRSSNPTLVFLRMSKFVDATTMTDISQMMSSTAISAFPAITILWHPDPRRVGGMFLFDDSGHGRTVALSRLSPKFPYHSEASAPLDDPFVSRQPCLELAASGEDFTLTPLAGHIPIALDGKPLRARVRLAYSDLGHGVVLTLGRRIALCLHLARPPGARTADLGLVGNSDAMNGVRTSILSVADLSKPVLIRGETGTGKELVARGIVNHGVRKTKPFVAVNIAALPPQLAVGEIFGHERGAFTDASRERNGYFQEAEGGTLFLDEIGLAQPDVQAALLRVLETGEVRRLGGNIARRVNVRVLAATDSDLMEEPERGLGFSPALFHRLSNLTIHVPPLRDRPQDLGLLLLHFLKEALADIGELGKLDTPGGAKRPWLDAQIFAALVACRWPGNVRQLRNFAAELAIKNRGAAFAQIPPELLATLSGVRTSTNVATVPPRGVLDHDRVVEALARNDYWPARAAKSLGVSRSAIYQHMRADPNIPRLSRVSDEQLADLIKECEGDLQLVAKRLRVSYRALQLRCAKA